MEEVYHIPAMLKETIEGLAVKPGGVYVDATFGGGGHSRVILGSMANGGRLYSFDQDMDAYENEVKANGERRMAKGERRKAKGEGLMDNGEGGIVLHLDERWRFVHSNFRYLKRWMDYYGEEQLDGVLADLGVSFHHFDCPERGFSFRFPAPLDMRMNSRQRQTAADIVNGYEEESLARVLYLYGELKNARGLAKKICKSRAVEPIVRTEQLAAFVQDKKDAAKLFQALRIEVNDEMGALRELLLSARDLLRPGGRMAVLTYHSLEDRLVKNFFRSGNLEGEVEKDFYGNVVTPFKIIEKGLTASEEEVARNPRSRSAKLRVAERV